MSTGHIAVDFGDNGLGHFGCRQGIVYGYAQTAVPVLVGRAYGYQCYIYWYVPFDKQGGYFGNKPGQIIGSAFINGLTAVGSGKQRYMPEMLFHAWLAIQALTHAHPVHHFDILQLGITLAHGFGEGARLSAGVAYYYIIT